MSHKTKSCKYCKSRHSVETGKQLPNGFYCSFDHAAKWANDKVEKARLLTQVRDIKKRKEKLKTKGDWMREAQTEFNKFIRLRDQGRPCISCDKPDDGTHQRHASHFRSCGASPELRFNELNVHASCAQCNSIKSGNLIEYRIRLIKKIGIKNVEYLEGPHEPLKLTLEDIKSLKQMYRDKGKSNI